MPWYNDGDWSQLRVDRMGHLLTQMMCSIAERQAKLGLSVPAWGPLGVYGTNPNASVLDGRPLDSAGEWLDEIRARIPGLYNVLNPKRCVKSDGTDWTEADLFTAAGYGAAWLELDRIDDVEPFMQTRAVIEQLIYAMTSAASSTYVATASQFGQYGYSPGSRQISYDNALTNIFGTLPAAPLAVAYQDSYLSGPTRYYLTQLWMSNTIYWKFLEKPKKIPFVAKEITTVLNSPMDTLNVTFNGVTFPLSNASTGTVSTTYVLGDDFPFLEAPYLDGGYWNVKLETSMAYPASHPFKGASVSGSEQRRWEAVRPGGTEYYVTELTGFTYG